MATGGQREIGDDLDNVGKLPLEPEKLHRTVLNRCLPKLTKDLNVGVVMIYIQQEELFDPVTTRDINEQTTTTDKILHLIDQIQKRDQHTYVRFKECLIRAQRADLKIMLDEEEENLAAEMKEKHRAVASNIMSTLEETHSALKTARQTVEKAKSDVKKLRGTGIPVEILKMDDRSIQLFENALKDGKVKVYSIRVMVVGHQGVGKTTLIKRLLGKDVNISERQSTEGIDVHLHCCDVSLSSHEWTLRKKESEQDYRLQRLAKVLILKSNTNTMVRSEPGKNFSSESHMKDLNKEMLQLLQKNADKIKHDLGKYVPLTIYDFAGLYAFFTTHQMFLSRRAIYLLVSDISKHLDNMVNDEFYFDENGKMECRVRELVEIWMNSVHCCAPPDNEIMNSEVIPPPVILVGTHADAIQQDNHHEICENYFTEIRSYLHDKPSRFHLVEEDFAIDNTIVDRKLEGLKKKIVEVASRQPYWGEEIPARWLPLEQVLMNLRAQGHKVIHRSMFENISQAGGVQISTDELDLFLRFQNEIGTIIYFSTELLKEKIVLEPQWMFNALKSLITAEMFVLRHAPLVSTLWNEFKNDGILSPELIDALWTKDKNADLHDNKDHLLLLMEQLNIIAKPTLYIDDESEIKEVNYFFAPFMLHAKPPREVIFPEHHEQMESSSVMCYVFTGKFLPAPIFHRLLAACVAQWPLARKKMGTKLKNQIFCDCGVFQIDEYHKLTLHFSAYIIFMRVTRQGIKDKTPSSKLCIEAKEFIAKVLNKLIGYLGHSLKFEEYIQCPEYNGESVDILFPVTLLKENAEVHCDFHDNIIESNKVLKFWFDGKEHSGDSDVDQLLPLEILSMDDNSIKLYKKVLHAGMEKVYNIRVMVVGQFGVGKTTLIKRLLGKPVDINETKSTEGIDVHKHCCKLSLDKGEWIQQHEDSNQLHTLNRLIKLLPVPDQKTDISQEQAGIREVIYQKKITSDRDAAKSNVPSTTSVSDQEVQSSTQLSITRGDQIHDVEHLDKETDIVAVPPSDAKNSESEKKTKDTMMDIIRLVNENVDKLVKDVDKYAAVSIWDFAGQYAFYTTHQMFLTSRAIYLLVIDLSQQINDLIKDDKCYLDADGIVLHHVFDLFQIWMNSIHSSVKSPKDIIPVIVVGTHVDKIPEKSQKEFIDKYFKELRYMLREKPTIHHLMDDIAIDNTQPDPKLEVLKRRIFELASQPPHWGEERPARWLPLEQAIMTLKNSGTKIVQLSLIEEINMSGSVKIEDSKEFELFLKFHHDIGTILYFSVEELRENIVLDPEWMIDALKSLITAETFIKKYPDITREFYEFIKTGKLTHELIDVIWSEDNNLEFHNHKDHILRLMEQLNIIAKPRIFSEEEKEETKEERYFLAPCVLQQETPEEIISPKPNSQMESSPVLCYVFIGKFLPSAIFHRLVAACIAHWPVAKKKKEHREENLIFCGCCVFQLDEQYKLTLLFREHVIFLRVTRMGIKDKIPSSKQCIEVREFITTNLNKIIGYLGKGLKFEYSIQCPEYNGVSINSLIPVSRLETNAEVHCEFHDNMIESRKVLDFWFEDQVKNIDCQDTDDADTPITQEHINHARLCNALTTVCSNALREILLTNVPMPHTDIYKAILANKAKLKLNKEQDQLVFPDPQGLSTGKVDEFDVSLLYTIIRNVSSVPAPSNGWGKPPNNNPRDTTLGASVERIRTYRNHISGHSVDGKISQQDFEDYWAKIDKVLREIEIVIGNHGYLEDLEKRKNQAITPHEAHELQKTFQEYKKQTEAEASDIKSTLKETRSALVTGLQTVEQAISHVEKLQGNQN